MDYIVDGAKTHPNRIDETINPPSIRRGGYGPFSVDRPNKPRYQPPSQSSGFQTTSKSAFANQPSSSFGTQAPAAQNHQPVGFAQNQNSSGFGVAQPQQQNSYGQPMQNSFAQPNQMPNAFGQPQQNPAPFGQPQNNAIDGFGGLQQPSQQQNNAFGQPQAPFGTQGIPISQQVIQGAFGQQSQALNNNGFGGQFQQQQQQQVPEGYSQQLNGGFSSFGNQNLAPQPTNGFGSQPANGSSAQALQNNQQQSNNISATNAANGLTHPDVASYTTRDNSGRLLTWKGARVNFIDNQPCYQTPDGSMERIWFPDGPPTAQSWEPSTELFTTEMMQAYEFLRQNGAFQGGIMPEAAPRLDMVHFNV
jgi:nucleoporin NUP42